MTNTNPENTKSRPDLVPVPLKPYIIFLETERERDRETNIKLRLSQCGASSPATINLRPLFSNTACRF